MNVASTVGFQAALCVLHVAVPSAQAEVILWNRTTSAVLDPILTVRFADVIVAFAGTPTRLNFSIAYRVAPEDGWMPTFMSVLAPSGEVGMDELRKVSCTSVLAIPASPRWIVTHWIAACSDSPMSSTPASGAPVHAATAEAAAAVTPNRNRCRDELTNACLLMVISHPSPRRAKRRVTSRSIQ